MKKQFPEVEEEGIVEIVDASDFDDFSDTEFFSDSEDDGEIIEIIDMDEEENERE